MLNEMKSIKEWSKLSKQKLFDYDGFMEAYEKLVKNTPQNFGAYQIVRHDYAGDMLCTRYGFLYGVLFGSSIAFYKDDYYREMSKVLPELADYNINLRISTMVLSKNNQPVNKELIEKLLNLISIKREVIQNYLTLYNNITRSLSSLSKSNKKLFGFKYKLSGCKTVEDCENFILDKIEALLKLELSNNSYKNIDKINELIKLMKKADELTARHQEMIKHIETFDDVINEYKLPDVIIRDGKPTMVPFNIIDGESISQNVIVDNHTNSEPIIFTLKQNDGDDENTSSRSSSR